MMFDEKAPTFPSIFCFILGIIMILAASLFSCRTIEVAHEQRESSMESDTGSMVSEYRDSGYTDSVDRGIYLYEFSDETEL